MRNCVQIGGFLPGWSACADRDARRIAVEGPWRSSRARPIRPVLDDVEAAFSRIETRGAHVTACTNGLIPKPQYRTTLTNFLFGLRNHFQGIQRLPQPGYLAISGSNQERSDLFIVRLAKDDRDRSGAMVKWSRGSNLMMLWGMPAD